MLVFFNESKKCNKFGCLIEIFLLWLIDVAYERFFVLIYFSFYIELYYSTFYIILTNNFIVKSFTNFVYKALKI